MANRYLTCLMPLLIMLFCGMVFLIFNKKKFIYYSLMIGITGYVYYHSFYINSKIFDESMSYIDGINIQKEFVKYCEDNELYNDYICTTFINIDALKNTYAGYLSSPKTFENLQDKITDSTNYILLPSFEAGLVPDEIRNNREFSLVKRIENKTTWGEIYKRIN